MEKVIQPNRKGLIYPAILVLFIIIADQALKLWVRQHMFIGQEISVIGDWFLLHFTENNGIAFGLEFFGRNGKLGLTLFRIFAAGLIGYFAYLMHQKAQPRGLVIAISMIFAGAVGNIIDSIFYGVLFDYEQLFYGKVVDMLYFPLISFTFPDWMPFWAGHDFLFFRPVFNIADAAITTGVFMILLFYRKEINDL